MDFEWCIFIFESCTYRRTEKYSPAWSGSVKLVQFLDLGILTVLTLLPRLWIKSESFEHKVKYPLDPYVLLLVYVQPCNEPLFCIVYTTKDTNSRTTCRSHKCPGNSRRQQTNNYNSWIMEPLNFAFSRLYPLPSSLVFQSLTKHFLSLYLPNVWADKNCCLKLKFLKLYNNLVGWTINVILLQRIWLTF